jgi:hypothetical protein
LEREGKAALSGAAVVAIYMAMVLLSGRVDVGQFGQLLFFYLTTASALWILVAFFWVVGVLYKGRPVEGQGPGPFTVLASSFRKRWDYDRCVSAFWPPLLFATLLTSFNAFKQMILPAAGFGYDPFLASVDRALFLGHDPWQLTHAVFDAPWMTVLIDLFYHGWFAPMSLGVIACAWLPAASYRLRTQYCLSYLGVWIAIGSILAFALPAAGPCFYPNFVGHSSFDGLVGELFRIQQVTGSNLLALSNQAMLLKSASGDDLIIGGGISAMPSVHNALSVLFAIAAFRIRPIFGIILGAYAALIWIGSIHLGWHYAVDGIAAALLVIPIWSIAGRLADSFDRSAVERAAEFQPA